VLPAAVVPACVMLGGIASFLHAVALPLIYKGQLLGGDDPSERPGAKISPCDCQDSSKQGHPLTG